MFVILSMQASGLRSLQCILLRSCFQKADGFMDRPKMIIIVTETIVFVDVHRRLVAQMNATTFPIVRMDLHLIATVQPCKQRVAFCYSTCMHYSFHKHWPSCLKESTLDMQFSCFALYNKNVKQRVTGKRGVRK